MNASRRRLLAATIVAPLAARIAPAHAARLKIVGYLSAANPGDDIARALAARGHEVRMEVRFAKDVVSHAPWATADIAEAAAELVRSRPDVLLTFNAMRTKALMLETRTIPIVCGGVGDPVGFGIARSLARPGFNVTGLSYNVNASLQLIVGSLRLALPRFARLVTIYNPQPPELFDMAWTVYDREMASAGIQSTRIAAAGPADVESILAARDPAVEAIMLFEVPGMDATRVAQSALRKRLAVARLGTGFVEAGGLMNVVMDFSDRMVRVTDLLAKVLAGANPAEMPFELPDRVHLEVNRATAQAIGVSLPPELLLRATKVVG